MRPSLTYILPDLMGGVFTYVRNLLRFSTSDSFETFAVRTSSRFCGPTAKETHWRGSRDSHSPPVAEREPVLCGAPASEGDSPRAGRGGHQ